MLSFQYRILRIDIQQCGDDLFDKPIVVRNYSLTVHLSFRGQILRADSGPREGDRLRKRFVAYSYLRAHPLSRDYREHPAVLERRRLPFGVLRVSESKSRTQQCTLPRLFRWKS